ncbi:Rieske (2Fe-2S) protein [Kitasatospora viridis]|uniref:Cytochrome bc1 complex Rieske iron-sulfur subunit n=1 Tax=Kitasatospora viridis TaxID=281105 RepID=A0A561UDK7_9ACTN|nr:Rieske (2Fe-2S) protein [Kitasatospora viridis]TWF97436.1 nitrite reductase/ring-hydroxylating ferredoxin subunit [Kitasatospora viridis]
MTDTTGQPATSRRTLLCCGAAVLAGGAGLTVAGCSPSSSSGNQKTSSAPVQVGPASDVPVGGGKVYRDQRIVVTQPTAGQYKAFSARCTHAGCVVDTVAGGTIQCPCHGSRFAIADGSVADGPAPSPLPAYTVVEQNGQLTVTES